MEPITPVQEIGPVSCPSLVARQESLRIKRLYPIISRPRRHVQTLSFVFRGQPLFQPTRARLDDARATFQIPSLVSLTKPHVASGHVPYVSSVVQRTGALGGPCPGAKCGTFETVAAGSHWAEKRTAQRHFSALDSLTQSVALKAMNPAHLSL